MVKGTELQRTQRWRLILGEGSEELGPLDGLVARRAAALDYLYTREGADGSERSAGTGLSALTAPEWINSVRELFPRAVYDTIEADALERYGLSELVTDPEVLRNVEPSEALLRAVLSTKHLMNEDVLEAARALVRQVVRQLVEALATEMKRAVTGSRNPYRRSPVKAAHNFDPKATIRANLGRYSREHDALVIAEPIFADRTRQHSSRWQMIIAVDQSGSMLDSVIHAAVTASIFHGIPALKTHLLAFDTNVVDLTHEAVDPVETLMQVQLGGGTSIYRALEYAEQLVENPRRTMVVLVSDLCEGGSHVLMRRAVARLVGSGAKVLVLGALSRHGAPAFDQEMARTLAREGAHVGVMTPHELASWVGEVMR